MNGAPFLTGRRCRVHDQALLRDWAVLGDHICVEKGAEIARSILWEDVTVKEGVRVVDTIVATPGPVTEDLVGTIR